MKWTKLEQLGRGGYGKVFKAKSNNGELFAWKQIRGQAAEQEVEVLKQLNHKNVIKFYGYWFSESDNTTTLVLELMQESVAGRLEKKGPFESDAISHFVDHILLGLEYIHSRKIIHGDLKGTMLSM